MALLDLSCLERAYIDVENSLGTLAGASGAAGWLLTVLVWSCLKVGL